MLKTGEHGGIMNSLQKYHILRKCETKRFDLRKSEMWLIDIDKTMKAWKTTYCVYTYHNNNNDINDNDTYVSKKVRKANVISTLRRLRSWISFSWQQPVTQICVRNEREEETRLWLKGSVKRHGRGEGRRGLRIANIFVVLMINEKLNECSESCRRANFSVLSSIYE